MGVRDDDLIEDWLLAAKQVISSQSEADALNFLLYQFEGAAKGELWLRSDEGENAPEVLFRILQRSFDERLTSKQAKGKFFKRRQKENESIQGYSHLLMVLLSRVERLNLGPVTDKDQLLQDYFLENCYDPQLRLRFDESLDVLRGAKYFSTKDLASSYN